jgi:hypothetical protein
VGLPSASFPETLRSTLAAVCTSRRLIAVAVVVVPLLAVQFRFSPQAIAVVVASLMCAAFVALAPALWRYLFPFDGGRSLPLRDGRDAARVVAYAAVGALTMGILGRGLPMLFGIGPTFLTSRPSLLASTALFWVGGWGLARDIDLELHLARERERAEMLAREAEQAQLLALKSHFDPHFLFNTLNAIAEWCRDDGKVAERAILELSQMLRTVMAGIEAERWPLEKEIELVDALFSLYRVRDPELFRTRRDMDAGLPSVLVPPMILLPIAENALKHGPAAGNRGEVSLAVKTDGGDVVVTVENPGAFRGPRDGGRGLTIIRRRIALAYGDKASFAIADHAGKTKATLRIRMES